MPLPPDPALVHARALRGRGSTLPPDFRPPDDILESWARCLDHGLDYAAQIRLPVASAAELARRRDQAGLLRRLAQAELETLMQQIAGSNFLLAFADADGTVLDVLADNRFVMSSDEDIVVGSCWREDVAGTNGLGTALRTGRGVAVTGPDTTSCVWRRSPAPPRQSATPTAASSACWTRRRMWSRASAIPRPWCRCRPHTSRTCC